MVKIELNENIYKELVRRYNRLELENTTFNEYVNNFIAFNFEEE